MPITVQRYLCSICGSQYDEFHEASNCENLGIPPRRFMDGETISFENEESGFGSRWSYGCGSGTIVLEPVLRTSNKHGMRHERVPFVKDQSMPVIHTLTLAESELGVINLVSLAENKYNLEMVEEFKNNRITQGILLD